MSDSDADEYVYYGTPLEQQQTCTYYASRQAPKQASQVVALPVHQQEVRDAQGRQRLHGAFTGGYSAGFFNTVGSEEGFKPAAFTSSRKNRAGQQQQEISDFLDEDELEDLQKKGLQTRSEYDTFASAQGAAAQAEAAQEAASRHGQGALNLFPQEALRPVVNSIGIQLLQKMGWRQGRGLGFQETQALSQMGYDVSTVEPGTDKQTQRLQRRKWGPLAGLQAHNAQVVRPRPKNDVHGLGFDPFANADEFRAARKHARDGRGPQPERDRHGVRKRGVAFAASVLEESDVFGGDLADYVDEDEERANLHFEVVSSDEDAPGRGGRGMSPRRLEASAPAQLIKARQGTMGLDSFIEGFERGEMAPAAVIESTPVPQRGIRRTFHRFARPCGRWYGGPRKDDGVGREAADAAAEPPADPDAKKRIDVMAATVARGGDEMLAFVRSKHGGDDDYAFLNGGDGAAFFRRRVLTIRAALVRANAAVRHHTAAALAAPSAQRGAAQQGAVGGQQRLTVEQRARLLQEPQLEGGQAPAAHRKGTAGAERDTPGGAAGAEGPVGGPAARVALLARAESAGLLRKGTALSSRFVKAGALAPEEGGWTNAEAEAAKAPAEEKASTAEKPAVRTVHEWRPEALLCKRFNVPDPYQGQRESSKPPAGLGEQLLSVPAHERGNAYSAALPDFMRPAAAAEAAEGGRRGGWEQEVLPPPPPRAAGGGSAAEGGGPAAASGGGGADLDQVADEILASVDADFAKQVEEAAPAPDEVPLDKPMDVFHAIFADSDSEDEQEAAPDADAAAGAGDDASGAGAPAASPEQRPRNAADMLREAQARVVEQGRKAATAVPAAPAEPAVPAAAEPGVKPPRSSASASEGDRGEPPQGVAAGRRNGSRERDDERHRSTGRERDEERQERHRSGGKRRRGSVESDEYKGRSSKHHKSEQKKDKKHRHKEKRRRDDDVAERAAEALRDSAMQQQLSTEEIIAMAKELKRKNKEKSREREKEKHKKHKHHKHSSSKRRRHESGSPSV